MKHEGKKVFLERTDLIRMNQLVRGRTDYERFVEWFKQLNVSEQTALIGEICHRAYQAGVDEPIRDLAIRRAGLEKNREFLILMGKIKGKSGVNIGGLLEWYARADEPTRSLTFKYFVFLFGEAERLAMGKEDEETCNHWWHRNLENPRVVESILNDPKFFLTSPKDDRNLEQ